MDLFSEIEHRKAANAKKLAAFGITESLSHTTSIKVIRPGNSVTLYTVGYERPARCPSHFNTDLSARTIVVRVTK